MLLPASPGLPFGARVASLHCPILRLAHRHHKPPSPGRRALFCALGMISEDIGTYRVFNPARHLPVTDADTPNKLIGKLSDTLSARHLNLLDD